MRDEAEGTIQGNGMCLRARALSARAPWCSPAVILAGALACLLAGVTCSVRAQLSDARDWESLPASGACVPSCRTGFSCQRGECIPVCSPVCESGAVCTEGNVCVQAERARVVQSTSEPDGATRRTRAAGTCEPECRRGFACVAGQCVSACNPVCSAGELCTEEGECRPLREPVAEEPAERDQDSFADSRVNLHADVLGLLQFGITPTVEVGTWLSGFVRVRPLNTGLMSYFLLRRDRTSDRFLWGVGATLGMHLFSPQRETMRGLFGGWSLEYAFVKGKDDKVDLVRYGTHALVPQLDFGYRWARERWLLGLAGRVGLVVPVGGFERPIGEAGCARASSCSTDRKPALVAGLALELGLFL